MMILLLCGLQVETADGRGSVHVCTNVCDYSKKYSKMHRKIPCYYILGKINMDYLIPMSQDGDGTAEGRETAEGAMGW